jgi:hypothetical protein
MHSLLIHAPWEISRIIEEKKMPWVSKNNSARIIVNLRIATLQLVPGLLMQRLNLGRDLGAWLVPAVVNCRQKRAGNERPRRAITMRSMTKMRWGSQGEYQTG